MVFVFWNIRKVFLWENIRNFLILELESFISRNIKKYQNFFRGDFFHFSRLGLKGAIGSCILHYLQTVSFWKLFKERSFFGKTSMKLRISDCSPGIYIPLSPCRFKYLQLMWKCRFLNPNSFWVTYLWN